MIVASEKHPVPLSKVSLMSNQKPCDAVKSEQKSIVKSQGGSAIEGSSKTGGFKDTSNSYGGHKSK